MLEDEPTGTASGGPDTEQNSTDSATTAKRRSRRASRPAGPPEAVAESTRLPAAAGRPDPGAGDQPAAKKAASRSAKKAAAKKTTATAAGDSGAGGSAAGEQAADQPAAKKTTTRTRSRKSAAASGAPAQAAAAAAEPAAEPKSATTAKAIEPKAPAKRTRTREQAAASASADAAELAAAGTGAGSGAEPTAEPAGGRSAAIPNVTFQAPTLQFHEPVRTPAKASADEGEAPAAKSRSRRKPAGADRATTAAVEDERLAESDIEVVEQIEEIGEGRRRRRRRGGRGRRARGRNGEAGAPGEADATDQDDSDQADGEPDESETDEAVGSGGSSRRRRRRRRRGTGEPGEDVAPDDPERTVVRIREPRSRSAESEVTGVKGSTRLEAKKQRRREGREAGRRRVPIISEAEFLARRESVERVMVIRQSGPRTQIAVLEDGVLVEHYVSRETTGSLIGNVYLGKVQNVLPSMEAAFVDIGKGRNAVLYAGEVNFDLAALEGAPKRIENVLKSGQSVLVQVTKDPVAHKGARLTSQISLPGRYLVYVPEGSMTGISRKLPDTERNRLKNVLRTIVPEDAGVIVRTAAEGASEEELSRDVVRLTAQWEDISAKAATASAPALLYGEPDLTIRVVRDIFNEDFNKVVVSGIDAWETVEAYVGHVAPDLVDRLQRWSDNEDVFTAHRIDEQLTKALDRKVWLPSGGSLIIDRTEAMTVIDVNTGKFTGQGGNLEETVTKNNLEAAEEIVRQLRLRDIGGIIVVDFIDMVLESNRELVLRRLLECLGRDRTKHQVAEVTSLGLVQMTRKRVGQGLLEAFSEPCEVCGGRGIRIHLEPVEAASPPSRSGATDRSDRSGQSGRSDRPDRDSRDGRRRRRDQTKDADQGNGAEQANGPDQADGPDDADG
ncbi:MAG: Rne/Rng family ribonuclease, partial [Sporichthyaceae bacterium]|nr:Rne/Rng family ribonuclease [Sporichthyaceae bacterium]